MLESYALDTIFYAAASFWHSLFLLMIGWAGTEIVLVRITTLIKTSTDVPINDGIRLMLFSVLCGTLNYVAGHLVAGKEELVLSMLGFNTKSDSSTQTVTKSTRSSSGSINTSSSTTSSGKIPKDFLTIYDLSQTWELLYSIQRTIQIVSPYLYIISIEGGLVLVLVLTYMYA